MSDTRYPTRMHEVLGVEVDEVFTWDGNEYFVNASGHMYRNQQPRSIESPRVMADMINNSERITRRPRLSEEQVKKLHAALLLGFKWLTVNSVDELWLFGTKPRKFNLGWGESIAAAARIESEDNSDLSRLVSWSDPEPLDIVATLKAAGVEVEEC